MESSDVLKISVSNQDWVLIEKWRIKGGMPVQLNMPIARIRLKNGTTSQFLSPINGFLRRTFIKENEVVQIGYLLVSFNNLDIISFLFIYPQDNCWLNLNCAIIQL